MFLDSLCRVDVTTDTLPVNGGPDLLQTEVEETLKRIQSHKGVIGTMVVNAEGNSSHRQTGLDTQRPSIYWVKSEDISIRFTLDLET